MERARSVRTQAKARFAFTNRSRFQDGPEELQPLTHVFRTKQLFDDYRIWRREGTEGAYLALVLLFSVIAFHDVMVQWREDEKATSASDTKPLFNIRPVMAVVMTIAYLCKHSFSHVFASWFLLSAHVLHLLITLQHAEREIIRVSDLSVVFADARHRDILQRAAVSEAMNRVIMNLLLSLPSLNLYELHVPWLLSTFGFLCIFIKMMVFTGLASGIPTMAVFLVLLMWLGSRSEFESRQLFLYNQRVNATAKYHQRGMLLELQASAGLSRLYHVLKNVLVRTRCAGVHRATCLTIICPHRWGFMTSCATLRRSPRKFAISF
jgi:hypothetical protein